MASFGQSHNPAVLPPGLPLLRYLSVNQANPFNYFNFLLDKGEVLKGTDTLNTEAKKLIHYFFLGITLPSDAFWVNLKPAEAERITSDELSKTDLGRTLLEQDLLLKKDVARYLHPHNSQGKLYWEKLYSIIGKDKAKKATITSSNRVWIVPEEAVVLETEDGALVAKATLKVLLESEYLSLKEKRWNKEIEAKAEVKDEIKHLSESLMKELILPAITQDINSSSTYAPLRQIYHSLILAEWFKRKVSSHKSQVTSENTNSNNPYIPYINSGITQGLESELPWKKQAIWQQYLKSYQEGEYKLQDTLFGLKRMYWSGGVILNLGKSSSPLTTVTQNDLLNNPALLQDLNIPLNLGTALVVADTGNKDNLGKVETEVISFGKEPEKTQSGEQNTAASPLEKAPPASSAIDLRQEKEIYGKLKETATEHNNVYNRAKYEEDVVKAVLESPGVQIAYLKIQDFKGEFNARGEKIGVGHLLGDIGLALIGPKLKEYLAKELKGKGIEFEVYNDGPAYNIIFKNASWDKSIEDAIEGLLKDEFRKTVVAEIKKELEATLGPDGLLKAKEELQKFTSEEFNIYAGLSTIKESKEPDLGKALNLADILDEQALKAAKYTQIRFSDEYDEALATLALELKAAKDRDGHLSNAERTMLRLSENAKTQKKSGFTVYSKEIANQIALQEEYGLGNEYAGIHIPPSEHYDPKATFDSLFKQYGKALAGGSVEEIEKAKSALIEKIVLYRSENIKDEVIFAGNDYFKILINNVMRDKPKRDLQAVFRIGGDEYGAIIWNVEKQLLTIIRVDGNNIGATTTQHGRQAADKIIDGQIKVINRVLKETGRIEGVPEAIQRYFRETLPPQEWLTTADYTLTQPEERIKKTGLKERPRRVILLDENGDIHTVYLGLGRNGEVIAGRSIEGNVIKDILEDTITLRGPPLKIIDLDKWDAKIEGFILKIPLHTYEGLRVGNKVEKRGSNWTTKVDTEPMVSIGYVEITANSINNPDLDFSRLQGRADSAADEQKNRQIKPHQISNKGEVPLDKVIGKAVPFSPEEDRLPVIEMTIEQTEIAKQMRRLLGEPAASSLMEKASVELESLLTFYHDVEKFLNAMAWMKHIFRKIRESEFANDLNVMQTVGRIEKNFSTLQVIAEERIKKTEKVKIVSIIKEKLNELKSRAMRESDISELDENFKNLKGIKDKYLWGSEYIAANIAEIETAVRNSMVEGKNKDKILDNTSMAKDIVENVIRLITGYGSQIKTARNDLAGFLAKYGEIAKIFAVDTGITVVYTGPPEGVWADFDRDYLQIVLANLINNAIIHGFSGTEEIEKRAPGENKIEVMLEAADGKVKISIKDNGKGIPADNLNKVYEYGFTAGGAGTGIGLSSVKDIIEKHGGVTSVESQEGAGTTFTITLSAVSSPLGQKQTASSAVEQKPAELSTPLEQKDTGGIDLSTIELTLKDDKYISSLNPADIKVLRAAKALKDEWDSLSLLYVHEIMLLLKDNLVKDLQNKDILLNILRQLQVKDFLDSGASQFFHLIQSQKSLNEIKLALYSPKGI